MCEQRSTHSCLQVRTVQSCTGLWDAPASGVATFGRIKAEEFRCSNDEAQHRTQQRKFVRTVDSYSHGKVFEVHYAILQWKKRRLYSTGVDRLWTELRYFEP